MLIVSNQLSVMLTKHLWFITMCNDAGSHIPTSYVCVGISFYKALGNLHKNRM